MNHETHQKPNMHLSKFELTIKSSQEMFKTKFKLTQKIQQLSSPIYERALSPWTRKRNESLIKAGHIAQQNNSFVNQQSQATAQTMRNNSSNTFEPNIGDFLRKIQFTKRKPQQQQDLIFSPPKKDSNSFTEKLTLSQLRNITIDQEKKLVVYPKQASTLKQDSKRQSNDSTVKKHKKKDSSDTLIATIQNFYDPFQHKSKQQTISSIPKGMVNLKLKIKDQLAQNKTTPSLKPRRMPSRMEKTFRKNSIDDRINQQNLAPSQNQSNIVMGTEENLSKIIIDCTQRTFFKTHKRAFSRRSITESTQNNLSEIPRKGSHQRSKTTDFVTLLQIQESGYPMPSGQVIRRIKMQQKRSRKVKTQVLQTINIQKKESEKGHNRTQSDKGATKQDKEYLYRMFLKYKSQKNSNDNNITKTLNMTFHNKESFQKNIEKALQLNPK